ncbi:type II toxin-antitoxin system HicB family antitoxin [Aureimonas sp. AU40]|uniref:type II toxin-antitoxin system HicB family antitoxin n=1 Tax=Aureimonas sp. AU40 TaxID=1637747 RepID=UPI000783106D|nr:type II toxin-antitoxin system HicB family antitoxin [Aureimonas sp. AU40]
MRYIYQAKLTPQEDGPILVTMPDVPMVTTFGETEAEARQAAVDALATALLFLAKEGEPIPLPATPAGPDLVPVELELEDALKLAVIEAFRAAGISKTELGRRLGKPDSEMHRLLDPDHTTKAGNLTRALAVLGKRAALEVLEAA